MSKKDVPKSQLDSTPLWQTAVDAMLRLDDGNEVQPPAPMADANWLQNILSEHGASPPLGLVADHYNELGEQEQEGLFSELNDSCGYGYSVEVVTLAKKKRVEETASKGGGSGQGSGA